MPQDQFVRQAVVFPACAGMNRLPPTFWPPPPSVPRMRGSSAGVYIFGRPGAAEEVVMRVERYTTSLGLRALPLLRLVPRSTWRHDDERWLLDVVRNRNRKVSQRLSGEGRWPYVAAKRRQSAP